MDTIEEIKSYNSSSPIPRSERSAREEALVQNGVGDDLNGGVVFLTSFENYEGRTMEEKIEDVVRKEGVVMITRSWCPFSIDCMEFLSQEMNVTVFFIPIDEMPSGEVILRHFKEKTGHKSVPMFFIKGVFIGGCDQLNALHEQGKLEDMLYGLIKRSRTMGADRVETARLVPVNRSEAFMPLFWFPNTVNGNVIRGTGVQISILSALSCAFFYEDWARYLAIGILLDFAVRILVGSHLSPIGMIATVATANKKPYFRPGPPKQFAATCGLAFSGLGVLFYFIDFEGHEIVGAVFMGMLAIAAGMEGFMDFCLGCLFFGMAVQFGLIPDKVYRIYSVTRQEASDSWEYLNKDSNPPPPIKVDTDARSPIALKYKKKSEEWSKDDFDPIRHIQAFYFAMPLSLTGLAVAFKLASGWSRDLSLVDVRDNTIPDEWYQVTASVAAFFFFLFVALYGLRLVMYPHKCYTEWDCPLRCTGFGTATITMMMFSFLFYDEIKYNVSGNDEDSPQLVARIFFWIGAVGHTLLTVIKTGEWMARNMEMEHVHPHWMILPVGLAVAALVGSIVNPFALDNSNSDGNILISQFFFSFAQLMWIVLFVISFLKVITGYNADDRIRHGVTLWYAAPCVLGLAHYNICASSRLIGVQQCALEFSNYFFIGIFLFLIIFWSSLPYLGFLGKDNFSTGYWVECFTLTTLAQASALFYALYGFHFAEFMQFVALILATIGNVVALLHTIYGVQRRRGMFTPETKWGPLSFMKLTHEAFRGNMKILRQSIECIDLSDETGAAKQNLGLFAAHMHRFVMMHHEHSKHEDQVIFKVFNDFFPEHAKKYNDDHIEDHVKLDGWCTVANRLLDNKRPIGERNAALEKLRAEIPPFLEHFLDHLKGEEDNLQPIGKKYLPIALMKQMSRDVWQLTPASTWEVLLPFIIENLPRHQQRVRYLKVLCMSMPERAQQFGAILYRNVDAVMWERLRSEMPEIIPRAVENWKRYY